MMVCLKIFDSIFSREVPYMSSTCPKIFELSLDEAKASIAKDISDLSDFGPLSLCFEDRILAYIVATILVPRIGSLSNISNRDVYILYCLLKKYHINGVIGLGNTCSRVLKTQIQLPLCPIGILVSRILIQSQIVLYRFQDTEVLTTYDCQTFASMGCIQFDKT